MVDFNSMENRQILISHQRIYGGIRSLDDIVGDSTCLELLRLLSMLSTVPAASTAFGRWALRYLPAVIAHRNDARDGVAYSRSGTLHCWKVLLRKTLSSDGRKSRYELLGILHELLCKVNDSPVTGDPDQMIIKAGIDYERDVVLFKLYRTQMTWLSDECLGPYVKEFEAKFGIDLECYVNVLLSIVDRCQSVAMQDDFLVRGDCGIDLHAASRGLGIDLDVLVRIMKLVSFSLEEGAEFSSRTKDLPDDMTLFRNAPFLRVSDTFYLPVDQKFVEELLFENLFYRIQDACGGGKKFRTDFGSAFEGYIQHLVGEFCNANKERGYLHIEEFAYGRSSNLSPDAMVFCSRNNSLLWIEAKSARYLDTVLSTEDNPEAIEKSFHKLKYAPWEQTHLAVQKILGADAHPQITRAMSHACLVVSMIDIPLSLFDHGVAVNGTDVSHAFHSLGVGAFELLLVAADAAKEYTLVDILGGAHRQRHRITAKTFILRLMKSADGESSLFRRLQERAADRHGSYFRDHLDAGAGA